MRSSYQHIIFDLDGTLSDSREGIFNAYYHTFEKLGISDPGKEKLQSLIGPPLQKGFSDVFGLQGEANQMAVKVFREYYAEKGLFENQLYDGMKDLIEKLFQSGATLYVATSKYIVYANQVLKHFGISQYFREIAGADYSGYASSKVELITGILRRNGIQDPLDVVIIGDTHYDINAATELAIDSIAVAYGFTPEEEVVTYNPDYLARKVSDLYRFLLYEN
ncbi:MAG TPA: HAD hydrolase-like protein [Bacteroidales bacterium]|nr:HAD hydrolase-like protein [Bacteroidales bacterium]